MPDFIQDPTLPPEPIAPQQPLPDNYRGGVQAPAKAIDHREEVGAIRFHAAADVAGFDFGSRG